jgi:hypothetical protein
MVNNVPITIWDNDWERGEPMVGKMEPQRGPRLFLYSPNDNRAMMGNGRRAPALCRSWFLTGNIFDQAR